MIDIDPEYLRSQRTLTESQVRDRDRVRALSTPTPAERLDMATHHAESFASRH